ncbi:Glutamine synthetase adenylyl-L-tyrosine phosphorylase / Glutamine synthetase adenylyl transferase [Candidatus Desulfarcum epimagneticum]|uniref:Glutamine synthetase adenylyl-L-tyrosine phosphorylase / Glutamine synthetase adenylyl transferase n=1 Tax=uncultured Desulfobacteraceae bacterium TaxID=218296 RepID=A0A484HIN4_9BACT|nr:Glutamine synthetase adenylyl-L-tyrosine phosphorylase / Glutamine synthetase adenylyl transferase [uncultured Desulfobacteraceae bacterium]
MTPDSSSIPGDPGGLFPGEADADFQKEAEKVSSFSDFVSGYMARSPKAFSRLVKSGDLHAPYPPGEYEKRLSALLPGSQDPPIAFPDLQRLLRQFRNREMVRIAWRDLSDRADLFETMRGLSDLADACLDLPLSLLTRDLSAKWGTPVSADKTPQGMVVLGMGKLGGRELNFSSDIDLIFAHPEPGRTSGGEKTIENEEFFNRLATLLTRALGEKTPDGFVFRIDLRLRPHGESGPMVMSFGAMEDYYQRHGREWERYAMIKARVAAGDKIAGRRLMDTLKPFVFRRYLDFGAFESLRDMKHMISLDVKRKKMAANIKLGPGGIREVEFFGQVFQLIRGGISPDLQDRSILNVLSVLEKKGLIPAKVREELHRAYVFLRMTENRLQEFSDLKVHDLPRDPSGRKRLAASLGFSEWDVFESALGEKMADVHHHFSRLLTPEDEKKDTDPGLDALKSVWRRPGDDSAAGAALKAAGYPDPGAVLDRLKGLKGSAATRSLGSGARKLLDRLVPAALKETSTAPDPSSAAVRILDFIHAIERRACYLSLLVENPSALRHLIRLFSAGPWILSFVSKNPALLDELLDPRTLYSPPDRTGLKQRMDSVAGALDPDDLERQMETLAIFRQVNMLRVAAADISGAIPLMKVSDHLSHIAGAILEQALALCRDRLEKKHGRPSWSDKNPRPDRGFAVIAYGKLGGLELGYASDIDLVFLHCAEPGETGGPDRPMDNAQFFARLGQRIITMLTSRTAAGNIYEIDMRLRPSGSAGALVSHIDAFREYHLNRAWTWEAQAMVRARAICGDPELMDRFSEIRKEALCRPRRTADLRREVADMRERMRQTRIKKKDGHFDIKQGEGALVDIEFIVQFLTLLKAREKPGLAAFTDNVRLIGALMETRVISPNAAHSLRHACLAFRSLIHRLNLREAPGLLPEERFQPMRQRVRRVWNAVFGPSGP